MAGTERPAFGKVHKNEGTTASPTVASRIVPWRPTSRPPATVDAGNTAVRGCGFEGWRHAKRVSEHRERGRREPNERTEPAGQVGVVDGRLNELLGGGHGWVALLARRCCRRCCSCRASIDRQAGCRR